MRLKSRLAAVTVVMALAAWGLAATAQEGESSACERSCDEQEQRCIQACGAHDDPIECEATCRDTSLDCVESCEE